MQPAYFGIEIGGTKLQLVAGDDTGRVLERLRYTVERRHGAAGIRQRIERALVELSRSWEPLAVGVGFGGPVDWRTGRVACSHHIAGWSDFELGEWVGARTDCLVRVDNDANMGALGEAMRGAGQGANPVCYVTLGSGVGGGLVVAGRIFHGARPGEAEIGHLRLDRDGTTVESRCSGWAVDARIRRLKAEGSPSLLCELIGDTPGGEALHLDRALRENDLAAWRLLKEVATDLAFGLSHVTHLFHPEVIVLGGGLTLLGEPLRAAVAEALPAFVMEIFQPGPRLRLAALGEDTVPVGCLVAARQRFTSERE